jgi:hypothetical protein
MRRQVRHHSRPIARDREAHRPSSTACARWHNAPRTADTGIDALGSSGIVTAAARISLIGARRFRELRAWTDVHGEIAIDHAHLPGSQKVYGSPLPQSEMHRCWNVP